MSYKKEKDRKFEPLRSEVDEVQILCESIENERSSNVASQYIKDFQRLQNNSLSKYQENCDKLPQPQTEVNQNQNDEKEKHAAIWVHSRKESDGDNCIQTDDLNSFLNSASRERAKLLNSL